MKRIFVVFFTLFLLGSVLVFGQTEKIAEGVELKWGTEHNEEKRRNLKKIISSDEDRIYMLRQRVDTKALTWKNNIIFSIQTYDKEGNLQMTKEIPNVQKDRAIDFDNVLYFNNKIFFFTSYFNKERKSLTLFVQEIDKKSLELVGKPKNITTAKSSKRALFTGTVGSYSSSDFIYKIPPNQEMLAIFDSDDFKRKSNDNFGVRVFDKNMDLSYENKLTTPYKDALFHLVDFDIDNNGTLFMFGKKYADERTLGNECLLFKYMTGGSTEPIKYTMNLGEMFVERAKFGILESGDAVCAGFYTTNKKLGKEIINGTFYQKNKFYR